MKTEEISFYSEFKCIGSACPYTCCRGWHVPVDETTYMRYHNEKGLKGLMLLFSTYKLNNSLPVLRGIYFGCNFRTIKGLCSFQKEGRCDLMPKICRVYPRIITEFPDHTEKMLELSCYEAARIFLLNPGKAYFMPSKEDARLSEVTWILENDDPEFLKFILDDRRLILKHLWREDRDIFLLMSDIYEYVFLIERYLTKDGVKKALERQKEGIFLLNEDDRAVKRPAFPIRMLNDLIYDELFEEDLIIRNFPFYRLLKLYEKHYKKIYENEADDYFLDVLKKMEESGFIHEEKYRSYLSYCIQEKYADAFEDYYPLGSIFLSFMYVEFLMLFDSAMFLENRKEYTIEEQASVLCTVEKGIRHSTKTKEEILKKIRSEL